MTAITPKASSALPNFCEGIQYFSEALPGFETYGATPADRVGQSSDRISHRTNMLCIKLY